jgi:XTP/dITP diphosphohydrolase
VVDLKLPTIVVATRNRGKMREFRSLLAPAGLTLLSLEEVGLEGDFEETGASFAENARLKALFWSCRTEHGVLADDSGLEVFALGRRPGVYSARYAGPGASDADRIQALLEELRRCGGDRSARFICALVLARRGAVLFETEGECRGMIADSPRGTNGFGYDPVFVFPELGRTYAELSEEEKNRHSHRANAVFALRAKLALAH